MERAAPCDAHTTGTCGNSRDGNRFATLRSRSRRLLLSCAGPAVTGAAAAAGSRWGLGQWGRLREVSPSSRGGSTMLHVCGFSTTPTRTQLDTTVATLIIVGRARRVHPIGEAKRVVESLNWVMACLYSGWERALRTDTPREATGCVNISAHQVSGLQPLQKTG